MGELPPTPEPYRLSDAENERIFRDRIVPRFFRRVHRAETPSVDFFGGQPGAGKSASQAHITRDLLAHDNPDSLMSVMGDEFRTYHPDYDELLAGSDHLASVHTNPDLARWVQQAISLSLERRPHVLLEGTLRSPEVTATTARTYLETGFVTRLHVVGVNEFVSRSRVFKRYLEQIEIAGHGRYTVRDAHDRAYKALPGSVAALQRSELLDAITLYDRAGQPTVTAKRGDSVGNALLAEALARQREPDPDELAAVLADLHRSAQLAEHYGRPEVLDDIRVCITEAEAALSTL